MCHFKADIQLHMPRHYRSYATLSTVPAGSTKPGTTSCNCNARCKPQFLSKNSNFLYFSNWNRWARVVASRRHSRSRLSPHPQSHPHASHREHRETNRSSTETSEDASVVHQQPGLVNFKSCGRRDRCEIGARNPSAVLGPARVWTRSRWRPQLQAPSPMSYAHAHASRQAAIRVSCFRRDKRVW
jgi:hypothetical protein